MALFGKSQKEPQQKRYYKHTCRFCVLRFTKRQIEREREIESERQREGGVMTDVANVQARTKKAMLRGKKAPAQHHHGKSFG